MGAFVIVVGYLRVHASEDAFVPQFYSCKVFKLERKRLIRSEMQIYVVKGNTVSRALRFCYVDTI